MLDASGYHLPVSGLMDAIGIYTSGSYAFVDFFEHGPMEITGSPGYDDLRGGDFGDRIDAGDGDDFLYGAGGNDLMLGGDGDDGLSGGSGNDTLKGGDGNDLIYADWGKDVLTGGTGDDTFSFYTINGVDRITDFAVGHDTIDFNLDVFTAFGNEGGVDLGEFVIGKKALDGNDHVIYDDKTGALYYDADGAGGVDQVKIAKLGAHLALTHDDFSVTLPIG